MGVVSDKIAQLSATPYKREVLLLLRRRRRRLLLLIIGDARVRERERERQGSSQTWKPRSRPWNVVACASEWVRGQSTQSLWRIPCPPPEQKLSEFLLEKTLWVKKEKKKYTFTIYLTYIYIYIYTYIYTYTYIYIYIHYNYVFLPLPGARREQRRSRDLECRERGSPLWYSIV